MNDYDLSRRFTMDLSWISPRMRIFIDQTPACFSQWNLLGSCQLNWGYLWTHPNVQLLDGYPEAVAMAGCCCGTNGYVSTNLMSVFCNVAIDLFTNALFEMVFVFHQKCPCCFTHLGKWSDDLPVVLCGMMAPTSLTFRSGDGLKHCDLECHRGPEKCSFR